MLALSHTQHKQEQEHESRLKKTNGDESRRVQNIL